MQMFRVILVWEEALQASGLTSQPSDSLQTATAVRLVESRVLYVGAKESLQNAAPFLKERAARQPKAGGG